MAKKRMQAVRKEIVSTLSRQLTQGHKSNFLLAGVSSAPDIMRLRFRDEREK